MACTSWNPSLPFQKTSSAPPRYTRPRQAVIPINHGAAMYLAQVCRYDQLARAKSEPYKAHMGAAKHLLSCYLAEFAVFSITIKQGVFKLTAFSYANWGANPDNGKSISSYIILLSNGPISFKVYIQG